MNNQQMTNYRYAAYSAENNILVRAPKKVGKMSEGLGTTFINTFSLSLEDLKTNTGSFVSDYKHVSHLELQNEDNSRNENPGVVAPQFPHLLMNLSRYDTLKYLFLNYVKWSHISFSMFSRTLPHLGNLRELGLFRCKMPARAMFHLPMNLAKRSNRLRNLNITYFAADLEDEGFLATDLWILSRVVAGRMISHGFRLSTNVSAVRISERYLLTAAEVMPSVIALDCQTKVPLRIDFGLGNKFRRIPHLSGLNKEQDWVRN